MIFVSILNYNKVVLSKGSHSQKIFCSLGLDAIVFCFGKQNCCKSLKIYIVFNLRNLNVFVFHVQRKTFFRFYLIFLSVALSGQQTLVKLHASRTNEDVRMYIEEYLF